jgi:hypothetical protein
LNVFEHHFEGFEVSVNVTDQSAAHLRKTSAPDRPDIAIACQITTSIAFVDGSWKRPLYNLIYAPNKG